MVITRTYKKSLFSPAVRAIFAFYTVFQNRLESFNLNTTFTPAKSKSLSLAGFFYTGRGDCVQCYSCLLKVSHWQATVDPAKVHSTAAPHCLHITQPISSTLPEIPLTQPLRSTGPPLTGQALFQAMVRLRHYQIFPTMDIPDHQIDLDAAQTWAFILTPTLKENYISLAKRSTQQCYSPLLTPMSTPKTPLQWFQHSKSMTLHRQHSILTNNTQLLPPHIAWNQLESKVRVKFFQLHQVDTKRFKAVQLEQRLKSYDLCIGAYANSMDNIVIHSTKNSSAVTPVSTYLYYKMSNLAYSLH